MTQSLSAIDWHAAAIWLISVVSIALVLIRPKGLPEAWWAVVGASLLVLCRLISPIAAGRAVAKGLDVYLFLIGMMIMSELARREGVFDWVAGHAVRASSGSRARLFLLIYCVGVLVTVFLSNDATAVVLTPAVLAAVRAAEAEPLPLPADLRFYRQRRELCVADLQPRESLSTTAACHRSGAGC
jgi:arsenical pump membrane protein